MRCPYCNEPDSQVKDSRPSEDDSTIKRRRVCNVCGMKFTTFEHVQLRDIFVRKTDGRVEPFALEKVERSIRIAVRKRSVSDQQIVKIASAIQRKIETETNEDTVSSEMIGATIADALQAIDPIAFVRFVSVYRKFSKISEFKQLIAKIPEPESGGEVCEIVPRKAKPGRLF
ncbi:MAG: transcriptional regulator NrdR [Alphaproteobacteria bacterium]|nr:transcriptional regulator NrdR [Alphaproteobacteria bacterium]